MNNKLVLKKHLMIIGRIITVVSIAFVIKAIIDLDISFYMIQNKGLFMMTCVVSIFIFSSLVYLLAYGWKLILDFLSKKKNKYPEISYIYAKSNIGKYLPGNVMHYVERNLFARQLSLKQTDIILSSIIEIGGIAFVAIVITVLFAYEEIGVVLSNLINQKQLHLLLVGVIFFFIIIIGILIKFKTPLINFLKPFISKYFLKTVVKILCTYAIFLCVGGFVFAIVYFSINTFYFDISLLPIIIAAYVMSWVVGFVVPGAPGGIGVREFVLVFSLGSILGEDITLSVALIHRLLTVLGDVIAWLISLFFKIQKNKQ